MNVVINDLLEFDPQREYSLDYLVFKLALPKSWRFYSNKQRFPVEQVFMYRWTKCEKYFTRNRFSQLLQEPMLKLIF